MKTRLTVVCSNVMRLALSAVPALALALGLGCGNRSSGAGFVHDAGSGSSSGGSLVGSGSDGGCIPNPANYDIPGNGCDDDDNGIVDDIPTCDANLMPAGTAHDVANTLGLCQDATGNANGNKWGIVAAAFTQGYLAGTPNDAQHGILPSFGSVLMPREGVSLGVLSSGFGRAWDDASGVGSGPCPVPASPTTLGAPCFKGYQMEMSGRGTAPPNYPKAAAACPAQKGAGVFDAIGITLQIKVPANAQGFAFDFDFHSSEWPEYVCTPFNDGFVAWLQSEAYPGTAGDLNISYDAKGNPVSVNNAFFDRCGTTASGGASTGCCASMGSGPEGCGSPTSTAACAGGATELTGTGFEDEGVFCGGMSTGGGATGWLTTAAPVKEGEVMTLQLIIWDTGDPNWDSSVLLDHFRWQPGPTMTGTVRPLQ